MDGLGLVMVYIVMVSIVMAYGWIYWVYLCIRQGFFHHAELLGLHLLHHMELTCLCTTACMTHTYVPAHTAATAATATTAATADWSLLS